MAIGPGKYDGWATRIIQETHAEAVVLLIVGGKKGHGLAVKTTSAEMSLQLPNVLRGMAHEMEESGEHAMDYLRCAGGEGGW
jgi:hypothetical protein